MYLFLENTSSTELNLFQKIYWIGTEKADVVKSVSCIEGGAKSICPFTCTKI